MTIENDNQLSSVLKLLAKMIAEHVFEEHKKLLGDFVKQSSEPNSRKLYTISQWCKKHPCFQSGGIRHSIFYSETNGFNSVIRRIGTKILIDEDDFFRWMDRSIFD